MRARVSLQARSAAAGLRFLAAEAGLSGVSLARMVWAQPGVLGRDAECALRPICDYLCSTYVDAAGGEVTLAGMLEEQPQVRATRRMNGTYVELRMSGTVCLVSSYSTFRRTFLHTVSGNAFSEWTMYTQLLARKNTGESGALRTFILRVELGSYATYENIHYISAIVSSIFCLWRAGLCSHSQCVYYCPGTRTDRGSLYICVLFRETPCPTALRPHNV